MSRRGANNVIRGPQSALTDFLASNNISAAQIRSDYERRQRQAEEQHAQESPGGQPHAEQAVAENVEQVDSAVRKNKRKREQEKAVAKIRQGKNAKSHKKAKGGNSSGDDDDYDLSIDMYSKKKPLPGQLENCEVCSKRFTVTPYSKTGPDGGLLCPKCSKEQETERKRDEKAKQKSRGREKRRQTQSNLLDGITHVGPGTLLDLCLKEVANNIHEVDEFGDLPQSLLKRLSQILSKKRLMDRRTLDLFLRPGLESISLYDCGKLETDDFIRMLSVAPTLRSINLQFAGQFKDEVLDYMMERDVPVKHLQLEAANLVTNAKWTEFFTRCGRRLESLKLAWLDFAMDDDAFVHLVQHCPNLKRIRLRKCFKLSSRGLSALSRLGDLEHLSLQFHSQQSVDPSDMTGLVAAMGSKLRTLTLEDFADADDSVLVSIKSACTKLTKLRLTGSLYCTDRGFAQLFSDWTNPPLSLLDFSGNRLLDCAEPDGPDQPVGLASAGFEALMKHSGSALEKLEIASCRHIDRECFAEAFNGANHCASLRELNISFLTKINSAVVMAIFKNCPNLLRVTAFGCFNVTDVRVPRGVALIGMPNAQDCIIQEGDAGAGFLQ